MPVMLFTGCAWAYYLPVMFLAGCARVSYARDASRRLRLGLLMPVMLIAGRA